MTIADSQYIAASTIWTWCWRCGGRWQCWSNVMSRLLASFYRIAKWWVIMFLIRD